MSMLMAVCAGLTLLPIGGAIDVSMLGYRTLCSFAPASTILLSYVAFSIHRYLKHSRQF
ncbi:hypothetical protein [Desulfatitalea alkaliphila]|uniref:Uncharacterized protein n=1 Tax=Desulfatitalea alkaliphila TaxID=2929485 RepID=A0AA41UJQ7_9BACT|nr:hypothetical protein [Desulfatitalea alkaliphila]MCJ8502215.1 hypothetical protein [Desulfatitalea alkaliphila]